MTIGMTIYVVSVYQILVGLGMIHPREVFQWIPEEVPVADIVQVPLQMEAIPGIGETGVTGAVYSYTNISATSSVTGPFSISGSTVGPDSNNTGTSSRVVP